MPLQAAPSQKIFAINRILIATAIGFELLAAWLLPEHAEWAPLWRGLHLLQMLLLIVLAVSSLRQLKQQQSHWAWQANLILAALVLSFAGDVINSNFIDFSAITSQRHLLSIGPFACAHILYVMVFWRSASIAPAHQQADSISNFKLSSLVLWLPLAIALWLTIFDGQLPTIIERATLFYACLVTLMAVSSTWIWRVWGDIGLVVTVGAFLFVFSDGLIGSSLSQSQTPTGFAAHMIWVTYFVAQCLIARLPLLGQRMEEQLPLAIQEPETADD